MFGASLDDTWDALPSLGEVKKRLQDWGIWEEGLTDTEAKRRYVRFDGVNFGVAPEKAWGSLRRDLLEFEDHIACE